MEQHGAVLDSKGRQVGERSLKVPGIRRCWLSKAVPSRTPSPFVVPVARQQVMVTSALRAAMRNRSQRAVGPASGSLLGA